MSAEPETIVPISSDFEGNPSEVGENSVGESSPIEEPLQSASQSKPKKSALGWAGVLIRHLISISIVGGAVFVAVLLHSNSQTPVTVPPKSVRLAIESEAATEFTGQLEVSADGVVSSLQDIGLVSQVAGEIIEKSENCRIGKMVQKGEVLFQIDSKDYRLALQRAQKEKEQAEASFRVSELELEQAKKEVQFQQRNFRLAQDNLKRMQGLAGQNVVSQTDLDNAERSYINAQTSLKNRTDQVQLIQKRMVEVKARWDLAKVAAERAKVDLDRTTVRAPITGRIKECTVEKGGFVTNGGSLVSLQDSHQLEVKSDLLFWQLQWMRKSFEKQNQKTGPSPKHRAPNNFNRELPKVISVVEFSVDGFSFYWPAHLSSLDSAGLDAGTRMIPVRLTVDSEAPLPSFFRPKNQTPATQGRPSLMTGMFVQTRLFFQSPYPVIEIPASSIHPGETVWYERNGLLAKTKVKVFQSNGDRVVVFSVDGSLGPGSKVITSPLPNPIVGMPVSDVKNGNGGAE